MSGILCVRALRAAAGSAAHVGNYSFAGNKNVRFTALLSVRFRQAALLTRWFGKSGSAKAGTRAPRQEGRTHQEGTLAMRGSTPPSS